MGPCKTCPHPQREFLKFLQFLCGCVLVQPFSTVRSSFCSVISSFPPFVQIFVRRIQVVHRSFELCSVSSSFPPFVWVSIGFLEVSCCLRGFNRLVRSFTVRSRFWLVNREFCWSSCRFVVKLQVSVKVSTSESVGVLLRFRFWKFLGVWEFLTD